MQWAPTLGYFASLNVTAIAFRDRGDIGPTVKDCKSRQARHTSLSTAEKSMVMGCNCTPMPKLLTHVVFGSLWMKKLVIPVAGRRSREYER
jgi:hypothetical protein